MARSKHPQDLQVAQKFTKERTQVEQGSLLKQVRGCRLCTSWIHSADRCQKHKKRRGGGVVPCIITDTQNMCGGEHHHSLYYSRLEYCVAAIARGKSCSKAKQSIVVSNQNEHKSCPACQGQHSYVNRKGKGRPSSQSCQTWGRERS